MGITLSDSCFVPMSSTLFDICIGYFIAITRMLDVCVLLTQLVVDWNVSAISVIKTNV